MNTNQQLITAIGNNNNQLAMRLLNQGANVNYQIERKDTPLFIAVRRNNLDMVKELLNRGANPNIQNDIGDTPLLEAIDNSNFEIVKELVDHGADLRSHIGETPLIAAVFHNEDEIVEFLLNHGVDPNLQNGNGDIPLIQAVREKNLDIAEELLNHRADPNIQNGNGDTPLIEAVQMKNLEMIKELLKYGANPDIQNNRGQTAFSFARPYERGISREISKILSRYHLNPALTNPETGVTNLMILVSDPDKFPLLEELFRRPEDIQPIVNQQDNQGNTALIYDVANNPSPEIIRFLLRNGANPLIRNNQGYSALDYAKEIGDKEIFFQAN